MKNTLLLIGFLISFVANAQLSENYYLPKSNLDPNITSPSDFYGFSVGEWHLSHDQVVYYLKHLSDQSDRFIYKEIGRTYEDRPLINIFISTPQNLAKLDEIQKRRMDFINGKNDDTSNLPVVIYQGNSIHGNEPSGGNAAILYAYYLAASKDAPVLEKLENTIVILDPCFNPDGFNRFASWVNSHKAHTMTNDNQDREYNEAWPKGRTNHYWFDLNRDWLFMRNPESKARIPIFQEWLPEILTDHHEMGTNATYFFQPGVPQRANPLTSDKNQSLTMDIARYHIAALDSIKSMYYTKESYDDYYYGKGSTYPDIHGTIGILFEQASSRGHLQESEHGDLSFPFTVKNQFNTLVSTFEAGFGLRDELLAYKKDFFKNSLADVMKMGHKGYVFGEDYDQARLNEFIDILSRQKIKVYKTNAQRINGTQTNNSYFVPTNQQRAKTVEAIFGKNLTFRDSVFYDVSAWTLPDAFNINFEKSNKIIEGSELSMNLKMSPAFQSNREAIAYIFEWDEFFAPAALHHILNAGVKAKISTSAATYITSEGEKDFNRGSIIVYKQMQDEKLIHKTLKEAAKVGKVKIYSALSTKSIEGYDVGSRSFKAAVLPKVALIVGDGTYSYDAGEIWHLFDQYYKMPITKIDAARPWGKDLNKYNVIVCVAGNYNSSITAKIKKSVENGATLIVMRKAVEWASKNGLGKFVIKKDSTTFPKKVVYGEIGNDKGSKRIGGAIFKTNIDLTHPLFYGYRRPQLPVFRNTELFFEEPTNQYAAPSHYTSNPLISGYIKNENLQKLKNTPAIIVSKKGTGTVIGILDNPNFRAFWWGTNKIFANAVFFGNTIDKRSKE